MPNSENYDDSRNNFRADLNLVKELNEMLSIENAAAVRIGSRIDDTPIEELKEILKRHLDVTNNQKIRLQGIIRQFGGNPTDAKADLLASFASNSSTTTRTTQSENIHPENLKIKDQRIMKLYN
jgi:ferritin-like metal-binding protein YciE